MAITKILYRNGGLRQAIGALTHSILGLTSTKTTELVQRTAGPAPPAAATLGCCKVSSPQAARPTAMPIIPAPAARRNPKRFTPAVTITTMEIGCNTRPASTRDRSIA